MTTENKSGSKKAIEGASQGGTVFLIEPEKLTRVTDTKHPLYDPRVHNKPAQWLINRISNPSVGYDQTQVIVLRKNGSLLEIVDGRHKHAAAMEVNRLRREEFGDQAVLIKVPVILKKAKSDAEYAETMLVTTYLRTADTVLLAAEKMVDYMQKFGRSEAEAAEVFGISTATVKIYQKLMELSDAVKKAVKEERISAHDAVKTFYEMTREDQEKNLEATLASSPKAGGKKDPSNPEGKAKKASPISRLRKIFRDEAAMESLSARERAILNWVYGQINMPDLMGTHPALAEVLSKKKPAKKKAEKKANGASAPRVAGATSRVASAR
jgi:ParB family chromosome partitioning protein